MKSMIPTEPIEQRIYLMRGQRVMIDQDLAKIYGVSTRRLNEQVKRNQRRFPDDFMFRLTKDQAENLMSQIATSSSGYGGRRKLPYVFTEHGAVMLAAVLNSETAVAASIQIVRAFNRLRQLARAHKDLADALVELKSKVAGHDKQFKAVFDAIGELMLPPKKPSKKIGFRPPGRGYHQKA